MGHWYTKEGKANHFAGPKGKGTSLREARKLNLDPSVTTIGDILAKPALDVWKQREVIKETLIDVMDDHVHSDDDRVTPMVGSGRDFRPVDNEYCDKIITQCRKKTTALADKGSDIHDILEAWYKDGAVTGTGAPQNLKLCNQVDTLLVKHCGTQTWIPEQTFSHKLGFGGKVDLYTMPDYRDHLWVIDYKSKDGSVKDMKGYPNQAEQLVAYATGLGIPNARTANIFISRDRSLWGTASGVSWFEHVDLYAWDRFKSALSLWQITKRYGPAFEAIKKEPK